MDAIREVIAAMYLAAAYAGGPDWLTRSNELLERLANDQETGTEAARLLRILAEHSNELYGPDYTRLAELVRTTGESDMDRGDQTKGLNTLAAKTH
jgi:hypothetical protein